MQESLAELVAVVPEGLSEVLRGVVGELLPLRELDLGDPGAQAEALLDYGGCVLETLPVGRLSPEPARKRIRASSPTPPLPPTRREALETTERAPSAAGAVRERAATEADREHRPRQCAELGHELRAQQRELGVRAHVVGSR